MPTNAWLPYVKNRVALAPNEEDTLYVAEDDVQGLGEVGRSGKIENLGPGLLTYQISDDGDRFMAERTLQVAGWDGYEVREKVKFYTIRVKADVLGCVYNVIVTAKAPDNNEDGGE
jgi:hypothetical protein